MKKTINWPRVARASGVPLRTVYDWKTKRRSKPETHEKIANTIYRLYGLKPEHIPTK